jgi:hypothetical protein
MREHLVEALDRADELLLEWAHFNELLRRQLARSSTDGLEAALARANLLLVEWWRFARAVRVQIELDRHTRSGSEVFDA